MRAASPFRTGDTAAALKSAESAVPGCTPAAMAKSPDQDAGRHHPVEHRVRHHHVLGAMPGGAGQHRHPLPGRAATLPTAAAAQALTANEEVPLQGGTRGKAERTAFTQAALAQPWVQNKRVH